VAENKFGGCAESVVREHEYLSEMFSTRGLQALSLPAASNFPDVSDNCSNHGCSRQPATTFGQQGCCHRDGNMTSGCASDSTAEVKEMLKDLFSSAQELALELNAVKSAVLHSGFRSPALLRSRPVLNLHLCQDGPGGVASSSMQKTASYKDTTCNTPEPHLVLILQATHRQYIQLRPPPFAHCCPTAGALRAATPNSN
jgi:hypothetical protein